VQYFGAVIVFVKAESLIVHSGQGEDVEPHAFHMAYSSKTLGHL